MQTVHAGLSIAAAIKPGMEDAVNAVLTELNRNPGNNDKLPFARIPTTHLVTGVILPKQGTGSDNFPATLMLLTSYTGPFKVHLDELVAEGARGLRDLFRNCAGFQDDAETSGEALKEYIRRHMHPDTFYTGMQYITHDDIGREHKLRMAIEAFIDQEQAAGRLINDNDTNTDVDKVSANNEAAKKKIQDYVSSKPEFAWAKEPVKKTFGDFWALWGGVVYACLVVALLVTGLTWLHVFSIFCAGLINIILSWVIYLLLVVVAIVVILGILAVFYRLDELKQHFVAPRQPDDQVRKVMSTQNHPIMNEMVVAGPIKHGWIHPLSLGLVLRLVSLIRATLSIPTIATARWLTIDGGKRLVFISNFENLSESYVRDFIDARKSAAKINLLFGQGNGYPLTKWVMGRGALTNPDAFLNDVHMNQLITKLWYWPYMDLSVDIINNNREIRKGLFAKLNDEKTAKWLRYF